MHILYGYKYNIFGNTSLKNQKSSAQVLVALTGRDMSASETSIIIDASCLDNGIS